MQGAIDCNEIIILPSKVVIVSRGGQHEAFVVMRGAYEIASFGKGKDTYMRVIQANVALEVFAGDVVRDGVVEVKSRLRFAVNARVVMKIVKHVGVTVMGGHSGIVCIPDVGAIGGFARGFFGGR